MTYNQHLRAPQWFCNEYELFEYKSGYKEIYIDRNTEPSELLFYPKEGDNWIEKVFRIGIWERNIETLWRNGIDLPFDSYHMVVYGDTDSLVSDPVPALRVPYHPDVDERKKESNAVYDAYAERFVALAGDRDIAVDSADFHLPRKNIATTPEKGQVVMDFGELPSQYDMDQIIDTGQLSLE